ncbi:hypothetical protein EDB84DRAFT_1451244 [Lactarius hengduanensis]|nr:hypothetical protein EDB84DRAFT_1451244 [Lactarius hengduanensis]
MPALTPSFLPPLSTVSASHSTYSSSSKVASFCADSQKLIPPILPEHDTGTQRVDVSLERERVPRMPSMKLEVPAIQEDMAASLAVALLGHVLFLKSQVPFPIAQLGRISTNASSAPRAAKKRVEMITAFDELSSHLHTTFSALSTALARNQTHEKTDTVYLALVLGPTIGAPKARVVLVLEGLEVKIWGQHEDVEEARLPSAGPHDEGECDSDSSDHGDNDGESQASGDSDNDADNDTGSDAADVDAGANSAKERSSSPPASEPPLSRTPSPLSDVLSQPSASAPATTTSRPLRLSLSSKSPTSSSASRPYLAPKPPHTHAEEQQTLRAAERLLARTLVNANAEGGGGMAVELAPTQTHILLRAPRRFSHPAWLPRQNASASLDKTLRDFIVDSGLGGDHDASTARNSKPRRHGAAAGVKTEGVLVTCQTGPDKSLSKADPLRREVSEEEDELIWWSWNGKLTGFAEW